MIDDRPLTTQIQEYVCEILNNSPDFQDWGIVFYPENALDIDFQIKNAMSKQGLACVVMTPTLNYQGHDALTQTFTLDDLTIQVVENTIINRARLKKEGKEFGTALDVASKASDVLAGPQSGHFGEFTTKRIEQGEDGNLVVAKSVFGTTMYKQVDGIIEWDEEGHKVEIPFVTKEQIKNLEDEVEHLQDLVIGFDTEEIKQELHQVESSIEGIQITIGGLSEIYQPIGNYLTPDDLIPYALKNEIPTKVSQLENDSQYKSNVYWDDIPDKPDVALKNDIPTKTSELENDSITAQSINAASSFFANITEGIRVGQENQGHIEMRQGDMEDGATITIYGGANSGGKLDITGDGAAIMINGVPINTSLDIPTKVSQLENDAGYITTTGLDGLATRQYVDQTVAEKVEEEASTREIEVQTILEQLEGKADLDELPTKLSQLTNDTGYLTTVDWNDVSNKPTTLVYRSDLPTKLSDLHNDVLFITEEYADSKYLTQHQSLENYATISYVDTVKNYFNTQMNLQFEYFTDELLKKADISIVPTKTSQLENDAGFITTSPDFSLYYTKVESNDRFQPIGNYLTTHQSLDDYYTIQQIRDGYQPIGNYLTEHQSLADYYTKEECDSRFSGGGSTVKKLYSSNENKYIDGDGVVYQNTGSSHFTPWEWSDGQIHAEPIVEEFGLDQWIIRVDDYSSPMYNTREEVEEILSSATSLNLMNMEADILTGTRRWDEGGYKPVDYLAYTSTIPTKLSQLSNDAGFITTISWDDIINKPTIPRKISDLINDSQFLTEVYWTDILEKPELPTQQDLTILRNNIQVELDKKADKGTIKTDSIESSEQKIDADGNVYEKVGTPGYFTDWVWSNGVDYSQGMLIYQSGEQWYIGIDQDTYSSRFYDSEEKCQEVLDEATHIDWYLTSDYERTTVVLTSDRQWVDDEYTWSKIDELAYSSNIPTDYATQEQVSEVQEDVDSNTSRISTLETKTNILNDGQWVNLVGEKEDGTTMVFQIFAKGI